MARNPSESAVRAVVGGPHNMPAPLTEIVGRAQDVERVCAYLRGEGTHLLTLTGPAGVGMTRLAIAVAHHLVDEFPAGARFVDLAPLRDPR